MCNENLNSNNCILATVLKFSWYILPLLILEVIIFYITAYHIENIHLGLNVICILYFITLNLFKKNKVLNNKFYEIQLSFLFVLLVGELYWYFDSPSMNQLFSFIIVITIIGLSILTPKRTILFIIFLIITLLAVNFLATRYLFNNINYVLILGVCLTYFNVWRVQLTEEINTKLEQEISRHKDTKKLLIENRKFTENVLDSSLDMIIAFDNSGVITLINAASLKRLGFNRDELLGQNADILYANDGKSKTVFDITNKGEKFLGEVENIEKNGNRFKSFLSATTVKNNEGDILGYIGVSRDLSEIEEIKRIISNQGSLIESLFKNESNIFIWVINKNMDLVSFNDSTDNYFEVINGSPLKKGENFLEQINSSIRNGHIKLTKEIYEDAINGKKIEFEAFMFDKEGKKYWINVHLSPIILPNGEIEEVICLGHDITDRKLKTRQIEENESNLRAVIKAIPDMIFKVSKTGEIIDFEVNSEEQRMIVDEFLNEENKLIGINIKQLFSKNPDHLFIDKMIKMINKTIKTEQVLTQNYEYVVNNSLTHFENRYSKVNNNEAIIVIRNRTEETENEQKLIESIQEKEILLKEVHHRVKNNLQIINSILNLQSSYVSDKKTLDIINESQNRIRSMAYIHESLYQTSNFSSINFKDYIENLITNLIYSYQIGGNIRLIKRIEEIDLPLDQAIPCGLILNEIITNALKYAYNTNEKGDIIIDINQVENKIQIVVEDFGVGLPINFDIETSESLGLSLVHSLVDQIDGELIVKSVVGTKFLIIFEMLES
jgi:PAS domain S-box-containing protein